jgi:hypothetical protein
MRPEPAVFAGSGRILFFQYRSYPFTAPALTPSMK